MLALAPQTIGAMSTNPRAMTLSKDLREGNPVFMQQKLYISSTKNYSPNEFSQIGHLQSLNHVPIVIKLSCDEEEHSSSVTYASEHIKNVVPGIFYVDNSLKMEMDWHAQEFDQYAKLQDGNRN